MIHHHPNDVTVFASKEAVFSCLASGADFFLWRVNETDINMLSGQLRDDIFTKERFSHIDVSTFAIKTRVAYNGTRVQCVVTGGHGSLESDIATLTIQGCNVLLISEAYEKMLVDITSNTKP